MPPMMMMRGPSHRPILQVDGDVTPAVVEHRAIAGDGEVAGVVGDDREVIGAPYPCADHADRRPPVAGLGLEHPEVVHLGG